MADDDDGGESDEMDMAAAIAAEQAEKAEAGGGDMDDMDMAAAIAAEQAEKATGGGGGDDDMDMAAAMAAEQAGQGLASGGGGGIGAMSDGDDMEAVYDIPVEVTAVLGTTIMPISQILKLGRGAVVELERGLGDAIEVRANETKIALGDVMVVDDRLAVTMTEIIKSRYTKG